MRATDTRRDPPLHNNDSFIDEVSEEVRLVAGEPRGFGSVRVHVRAGASEWDTSVFPDAESGCFVLPVKKAVRNAERIEEGDEVTISLRVREDEP